MDALINGQPDDKQLDAPATVLSDFEALEGSASKLLDYIESVSAYVNKVVVRAWIRSRSPSAHGVCVQEGKAEGDTEIGRAIGAALAAVPPVEPAAFDKMFSGNMQVRCVLAIFWI